VLTSSTIKGPVATARGSVTKAIKIYEQIPINLVNIDLNEALEIVDKHKVYAYDAYMIACALNQDCPLLTLDGGLAYAARAAGVEVWEAN